MWHLLEKRILVKDEETAVQKLWTMRYQLNDKQLLPKLSFKNLQVDTSE